ncbi:dehydrogenase [Shinella sp. M31]|uniref:dehydrogenase n=1 Tax=Shinella sp. M31 TaxID=3368615 RepID=UPI003BA0F718
MRPIERQQEETSEIDEALAWHDGDALATIATLLQDCRHLRGQIAICSKAMSRGYTRGWRPDPDSVSLED